MVRPIVDTPDGHPRADELTAAEAAYQSRLRSAVALLSAGSSGTASQGQTDRIAAVQVESPEPRVCRVVFAWTAAERAAGATTAVRVILGEGVDGGGYTREYLAPAQGLAIAIPAGFLTLEIKQTAYGQVQASSRCAVSVSAGVLSSRWYTDPDAVGMLVDVNPLLTTYPAPVLATQCRALVLAGSLVDPTSGATIGTAGADVPIPIGVDGLVTLSAGLANTRVALRWEITE